MANEAAQMAAWIVANKDKKGSPEFEKVATAFKVLAAGGIDQYAEQQVGPAKPQPNPMTINAQGQPRSAMEQVRIGAGYGLNKLRRGLSQAAGLTSQAEVDQLEQRDRPIEDSGLGRLGMVGGSMIAGGPLGSVGGAGKMIGSALVGGALGAAQPTETGESRGYNALAGALAGAGGRALFGAGGGGMNPRSSPQAEALMRRGVRVTPGDMFGGAAKRVEESLTSWPILGDAIRKAKGVAVSDWNNSIINRYITQPLGVRVQGSGHDAVRKAYEVVSQTYDDVLSRMGVKLDQQAVAAMTNVRQLVAGGLARKQQARFEQIMDDLAVSKLSPSGGMTGQTFKQLTSVLRERATAFMKAQDPEDHLLGRALHEVHNELMQLASRQNPQMSSILRRTNYAYANLLRVEAAAGRTTSKDGVFSPAALNNAARGLDRSLRKRQFSHGRAPMQRPAQEAIDVMGPTVPDSGTPYRLANMLMAVGATGSPGIGLPAAGGLLAASAPYTQTAHPLVRALLTQRTPAMRQLGQQFANRAYPYAGVAAAPFAKRDEK